MCSHHLPGSAVHLDAVRPPSRRRAYGVCPVDFDRPGRFELGSVPVHCLAAGHVPVQYFQSVIAIELAVAGALLWQMRYFESREDAQRTSDRSPSPRLRLCLALVLGATVFGSLWAMADEGPKWAALAVTVGLAVSVTPILLRVLPPLARDVSTNERDPDSGVAALGIVAYAVVVAGFLVLLDLA